MGLSATRGVLIGGNDRTRGIELACATHSSELGDHTAAGSGASSTRRNRRDGGAAGENPDRIAAARAVRRSGDKGGNFQQECAGSNLQSRVRR